MVWFSVALVIKITAKWQRAHGKYIGKRRNLTEDWTWVGLQCGVGVKIASLPDKRIRWKH